MLQCPAENTLKQKIEALPDSFVEVLTTFYGTFTQNYQTAKFAEVSAWQSISARDPQAAQFCVDAMTHYITNLSAKLDQGRQKDDFFCLIDSSTMHHSMRWSFDEVLGEALDQDEWDFFQNYEKSLRKSAFIQAFQQYIQNQIQVKRMMSSAFLQC